MIELLGDWVVERQALIDALPQLVGRTVLVVGDVCLDDYFIGRAARLSREAPVPVLEFEERRQIAGAAANPAANIAALGGRALLLGVVGEDDTATHLRDALTTAGIDVAGLVVDPHRPTALKMRVLARGELHLPQQLARIDRVHRQPISPTTEAALIQRLNDLLPSVEAVLFSDYGAGLVTPALVQAARQWAEVRGATLTADSQGNLAHYQGFTLVKCNQAEAERFLHLPLKLADELKRATQHLLRDLNLGAMLITRGAEGAALGTRTGDHWHLPAANRSEVFDVTGAGDTVIAVTTVALASGWGPLPATILANYAAGLVVRKLGNATPTLDEMRWALSEWTGDLARKE